MVFTFCQLSKKVETQPIFMPTEVPTDCIVSYFIYLDNVVNVIKCVYGASIFSTLSYQNIIFGCLP